MFRGSHQLALRQLLCLIYPTCMLFVPIRTPSLAFRLLRNGMSRTSRIKWWRSKQTHLLWRRYLQQSLLIQFQLACNDYLVMHHAEHAATNCHLFCIASGACTNVASFVTGRFKTRISKGACVTQGMQCTGQQDTVGSPKASNGCAQPPWHHRWVHSTETSFPAAHAAPAWSMHAAYH